MEDCVAVVAATVAAYWRHKQIIKNIDQSELVLGLLDQEDTIVVSREHICSLCNMSHSSNVLDTD